jgi:hypothetical protein
VNNQRKWFQDQTDPVGSLKSQVLIDDDKQTRMASWWTSSHSAG